MTARGKPLGHVHIDLTMLARWSGPFVGIPRCQKEYATYALDHVESVRFTLFDSRIRRFRHISADAARKILEGRLKADMLTLPDVNAHRIHFVDRLPAMMRPAYWWLSKTRRRYLALLEEKRLAARTASEAHAIKIRQDRLIKPRERADYYAPDGRRIDRPAFDALAGGVVEFKPDDVTLAIQGDWAHTDIGAISSLKAKTGWRHVILCHDLIPALFPHWYDKPDVDGFISYYDRAFAAADRVMFTSRCTRLDAETYCRQKGLTLRDSAVVPMGADFSRAEAAPALPDRIAAGKFALFVSTIEPRKNHRMLLQAWRALAKSGVIDGSAFKLVFVGRDGWKMGAFDQEIAADPLTSESVIHLSDVDDAMLERLYRDAAFCLYPPLYEGFGLPIIEALAHGKALLVSSAGPMAEIAGDHAIALDPGDAGAWAQAMGNWIDNPGAADFYAARARETYRPLGWEDSAQQFFNEALAPFSKG